MNSKAYQILGNLLEGCQVIGFDWRYLYVNEAVARQGRRSRSELLGHTMMEVYPGIEHTAMFSVLRECMQARRSNTFENEFIFPDGTPGWFELRVQPVPEGIFILSIDVTGRVLAERSTARQLARLRSLREIDLAILGSTDVRLTLRTVLHETLTQPQVAAAAVFLVDASETVLEQVAALGFRDTCVQRRIRLGDGLVGRAAAERRRIVSTFTPREVPRAWAEEGFSILCVVPLIAKGRLVGVLVAGTRAPAPVDDECLDFLEALAGQAAMAIDAGRAFDELQRAHVALALAYDTTIEGWANALSLRDQETREHTARVTEHTLRLARHAGLTEAELVHVKRGALLHDIGKMGVPDAILRKPGPLTEEEFAEIRKHPTYAYELLWPIAYLRPALDIPYCHHERWDGTGYPRGLKGEAIPLSARLFSVVDVWDALCSDRAYRPAWPPAEALAHIRGLSGVHFDPRAVELFVEMLDDTPGDSRRTATRRRDYPTAPP